jgi:hypothetical protein
MRDKLRSCWGNCGALDDKNFLTDEELLSIDAMEDSISPLDETAVKIRELITRFESCYHEADKEAERIIGAIGSGQPPAESDERPPQRKRELQNSLDILSAWCEGDLSGCLELDVGGISAGEMADYLGEPTELKIWQVQRMMDQLKWALDRSYSYHVMALDMGEYGEPIEINAEEHYKDHLDFLNQTTTTMIHYTLDGKDSEMSLALAIDLHSPCNWNYVGNLVILLKAINGDLHPKESFAPCSFNAKLTPLRGRLKIISNTLKRFCEGEGKEKDADGDLLALLGAKTDKKQWLAASLGKTIRLHQEFEK